MVAVQCNYVLVGLIDAMGTYQPYSAARVSVLATRSWAYERHSSKRIVAWRRWMEFLFTARAASPV